MTEMLVNGSADPGRSTSGLYRCGRADARWLIAVNDDSDSEWRRGGLRDIEMLVSTLWRSFGDAAVAQYVRGIGDELHTASMEDVGGELDAFLGKEYDLHLW